MALIEKTLVDDVALSDQYGDLERPSVLVDFIFTKIKDLLGRRADIKRYEPRQTGVT